MYQGTSDLNAPHLAAGQLPNSVAAAVSQIDLGERSLRPSASLTDADAMQRGMIEQVLHHRQVEVQCACLEYDPQPSQGLSWFA